jgi:hypothetical protein
MMTAASLREQIIAELKSRVEGSGKNLVSSVRQGKVDAALAGLVFFTPPSAFTAAIDRVRAIVRQEFASADGALQQRMLLFLVDLTLWLRSFLPRWNLQDAKRHASAALADDQISAEALKTEALAIELSLSAPQVARTLLAERRAEIAPQFKAEGVKDPEAEAASWVGGTVKEYLANVSAAMTRSQLRRMADMRNRGETISEISNDYAAFLRYPLLLGASFVTCNPPLVDLAWVVDPPRWNGVVDAALREQPDASGDALARRVTLEVVLANMHELRPIFLLTEGRMGCVSLQVNPKKHGDAETMIADAQAIYAELRGRLGGGVPNVVFKLPGTKAGLEACRALTSQGIGVTITVNFGLFQHLRFAQTISEGQALFCTIAHMSGRMAFPVRDELLGKLDTLRRYGIDEAKVREAAAWSGVVVLKRFHRLLTKRGIDLSRVKPLIASMRIYEGDAYRSLPNPIPDISEVIGVSILTIFPNVRRAFDSLPNVTVNPRQIETPVPDHIWEVLSHSEIFRQAYYIGDPGWGEQDEENLRPQRILTLEDIAGTAEWPPVYNTLTEFCKAYDVFVNRIEGRRRLMQLRQQAQVGKLARATNLEEALTHFDRPTVRETLELVNTAPAHREIGAILKSDAVRQALQAPGDDSTQALYQHALARHAKAREKQPLRTKRRTAQTKTKVKRDEKAKTRRTPAKKSKARGR